MAAPTVTTEIQNAGSRLDSNASSDATFASKVTGDAADRWHVQGSGKQEWGDGTNAVDTNLYRGAAALVQTDHSFKAVLGVKPALGAPTRFWCGGAAQPVLAVGTDTAGVNGTVFFGAVFIPVACTLTGIGFDIGSVGGTDKAIVMLFDPISGAVLANSALAGVTVGTAGTGQELPFTATLAVVGPAQYIIGVQYNGATAKLRTFPTTSGVLGGSAAQTFGTPVAITPPATVGAAPIAWTF